MSASAIHPSPMRAVSWRRDALTSLLGSAVLLLLPLIAMQFTREMAWSFGDFVAAAVLVSMTGFALLRIAHLGRPRWLLGAVAALAVLVWLELAVGLVFGIGS